MQCTTVKETSHSFWKYQCDPRSYDPLFLSEEDEHKRQHKNKSKDAAEAIGEHDLISAVKVIKNLEGIVLYEGFKKIDRDSLRILIFLNNINAVENGEKEFIDEEECHFVTDKAMTKINQRDPDYMAKLVKFRDRYKQYDDIFPETNKMLKTTDDKFAVCRNVLPRLLHAFVDNKVVENMHFLKPEILAKMTQHLLFANDPERINE